MIVIGVDFVDLTRFEASLSRTPALREKLLTPAEAQLSLESMAARFAAKEALAKALGAPGNLEWHDAVVITLESGQPVLELRGTVLARARDLGVTGSHLSLSHDGGAAIAFVVLT